MNIAVVKDMRSHVLTHFVFTGERALTLDTLEQPVAALTAQTDVIDAVVGRTERSQQAVTG